MERRTATSADDTGMSEHTNQMPVAYTAAQVAEMLQVSKRTVERATTAGAMPYRKTGTGHRSRRYTREDVQAYLDGQRTTAADR